MPPTGCGEARQGGDLADDDEHDQASHEAGDDRLAEELRDPAQAQQADRDEDDAGRDREHRGQLDGQLGVTAGQGAHDRPRQHRDRRDRPDEQQPRGAEERVGEQGGRQRVEADLHGYARDDGVPEGLGDGQGGDEQAGEEVGGQVAAGVPAQQTQPDGEARRWQVHGGQSAAASAAAPLAAVLAHVRVQDVIDIASTDRFARSVVDLDKLVTELMANGGPPPRAPSPALTDRGRAAPRPEAAGCGQPAGMPTSRGRQRRQSETTVTACRGLTSTESWKTSGRL